ncbi:MAG TPA: hypothetical protein ENH84_07635 [Phycisphaerae bacterium]|nr:hypothetical protein [Phycisphaerae bacterium]
MPESTRDTILIRRAMTEAIAADILTKVCVLLIEIADEMERQKPGWDGEEVSAEEAYRGALVTSSEIIRSTAQRMVRSINIHS